MSSAQSSDDNGNEKPKPQTRLELSVNPADGTLLTAPLTVVINTATDALYNDLQNMSTGQPMSMYLPSSDDKRMPFTEKSEAMASLSFQERRHVIASRIARHLQSLSHVSALVASNLPTSGCKTDTVVSSQQPNIYALAQIPPENELSQITQTASQALEHVTSSWVSADTAQDSLYFHHDSLWKVRHHPHDILGSMEVLLKGKWTGLSRDLMLGDKYKDSTEKSWDEEEMKQRLKAVIRRKLVLGEVGNKLDQDKKFKWEVVFEKDCTSVRLLHGKPRLEGDTKVYPIEARVTVLSEDNPAPWTLLSIRTRTAVKTGESNHQLELSKEQMFTLHKICERAMIQEEIQAKKENEESEDKTKPKCIPRPLSKLLEISHVFSLSWQMEVLSAQADKLRKSSWLNMINVTPVKFIPDSEQFHKENRERLQPLAILVVHFWEIDDRNGYPKITSLSRSEDATDLSHLKGKRNNFHDKESRKMLSMEVTATPQKGIEVSLSGGNNLDGDSPVVRSNIMKLLSSLQDPFQLSVSDALLSAVLISAERRCRAVRNAILRFQDLDGIDKSKSLPSWIHLTVESGSISVGVDVKYNCKDLESEKSSRSPIVLFRLSCDSRTGLFIPTFHSSCSLLRHLSCNDPKSSEMQMLRQVKASSISSNASFEKSKLAARGRDSTGRITRDAFVALERSIDVLGKRVGIGGDWVDKDPSFSPVIREKSIREACGDVCIALRSCAAISTVFGIGGLALGVVGGTNAVPDMSGGSLLASECNLSLVPTPPLSTIMSQQLITQKVKELNGDMTTIMKLERELCCVTASATNESLTLRLFCITTVTDSAISRKYDHHHHYNKKLKNV